MGKLFGTDGIRGVANIFPMTPEMVLSIGKATAHVFKEILETEKTDTGHYRLLIKKKV